MRRSWWYQSWFLLMIAGGLAAFAAWALIEPHFNDIPYVQGTVSKIHPPEQPLPASSSDTEAMLSVELRAHGIVELAGERVWVPHWSRRYGDDKAGPLEPGTIRVGDEVGLYCEVPDELPDLSFAAYVVLAPDPLPHAEEQQSLQQQAARSRALGFIIFAIVAALVGLAIGAADGIVCRLPRRAVIGGALGLLIGFVGGFVATILAGLVYGLLSGLAMEQEGAAFGSLSGFGFFLQVVGRGMAWMLAGMSMGLAQGIVLRSKRLLLYGFLGGVLGGLVGGLLFDPIDFLIVGVYEPSAHVSRLVGFTVIGLMVGAMIGVVELLARDAWLRMTKGPLQGKEFLIFKDLMRMGSSPRSDIYLFNDDAVADHHASLRTVGDDVEIENLDAQDPVRVNGRPVQTTRLRHGDVVSVGSTEFVYQRRKG